MCWRRLGKLYGCPRFMWSVIRGGWWTGGYAVAFVCSYDLCFFLFFQIIFMLSNKFYFVMIYFVTFWFSNF
jgi:hypothetical protein